MHRPAPTHAGPGIIFSNLFCMRENTMYLHFTPIIEKILTPCENYNVFFIGFIIDCKIFERKIVNIFLPITFNMCFGCSKEQSH